ncbi:Glutamyl-tRNA reductase [Poriferisphaera corsica]|uniref:Glutamyl-tRNA reductase n=1 Tax=Poriferisphaera corsica TaxID=2528020 RepID=A0A517YU60_9BACT|nr:glutamyl-tRNA reductase [Poriferisphaera corsica]QDU33702.1 Glutamyl-tRNA reductase [Poriferisphaera corsica]
MRIHMFGINHRTAPVDIREQLSATGDSLAQDITTFNEAFPNTELVILSTCNRTEYYFARSTHEAPQIDELRKFLATLKQISVDQLTASSIHREQQAAIQHLLHVATGLDSMVIGETEILGQIKRAYETATQSNTVGPILHGVFQEAIAAAKQIRSQTGIDSGRISIGSVAVDFARQIFADFTDKNVLAIGAGEIAKVTLTHLRHLKPKSICIVNRSVDNATKLAEQLHLPAANNPVRNWEQMNELLVTADIVISSTASPTPILELESFKPFLKRRRNRPLFLLDLAVPRDIDPAIGSLTNVYLYNVDDLQSVIAETHDLRAEHIQTCESYLEQVAKTCMTQINNRDLGQLVRQLRHRLQDIGQLETQRTINKLSALYPHEEGAHAQKLLDEHTHRLINKILHMPLSQLDHNNPDAPLGFYASALRRLFDLDEQSTTPHITPTNSQTPTPNRNGHSTS